MNKTMKSWITELKKINDATDPKGYSDHLIVVLEVDENGHPSGKVLKVKGSAFLLTGMVEMAMHILQNTKREIFQKFEEADEKIERLQGMPEYLMKRLKTLEARAQKAKEENDVEELEKIRKDFEELMASMKNMSHDSDNDSDNNSADPGDFNIDDFKGGF